MAPVALAFGVLQLTGSATWLSVVTTAALGPMLATLLLGGGIADRYRRDTVLALASIGAGVTQAGVAVVLLIHLRPVWLVPLSAGNGIFLGLTIPVLRGIVANLVSGRGLQRASSLLAAAGNASRIVGPGVAGLLTASVGGGWAIAVDAGSFLVAAAFFARMSLPVRPARGWDGATMVAELREGWGYFRGHAWVWSVTMAFAVFNAVNRGVWQILGPVIANATFGVRAWGLILSVRGIGGLVAGVVMVRLTLRRPMVPALAAMALAAVPLILLGAGTSPIWLAGSAFLAGAATELFTVVWSTVCVTHIPERLLSRVGAHDEFWSTAPIPLGQLATPVLASTFGAAAVAVTGGAVAAVAILLPAVVPALRTIELSGNDDRRHG